MIRLLLVQLAGLGLLLCPVVCAGGLTPSDTGDDVVHESLCCGGCHSDEDRPSPTHDDEERDCVASRANVEAAPRSAEEIVRALAEMPAQCTGREATRFAPMIGGHRRAAGREFGDSEVPLRTLVCALLL